MYNYYLDHAPVDVSAQPVREPLSDVSDTPRGGGLFSALSDTLRGGSLSDLFTEENLMVLGAVAFLTYGEDGFDKEALALCVLCLLLGL